MTDTAPLSAAPCGLETALAAKGFEHLMPIQAAVLAPETEGRDLRITSQTGSGKTVAVGLAVAEDVEAAAEGWKRKKGSKGKRAAEPAVVFIAPTRELAQQLGRELDWLFRPLGGRVVVVTGGTSVMGERRELAGSPTVVVGTPGRLRDHLEKKAIDLSLMTALVLDEADEMLDMGFEEDLDAILAFATGDHRTHLVSATFTGHALRLANRVQPNPLAVEGTPLGEANTDIEHRCIQLPRKERLNAIINLLLHDPDMKTLIFVRTRIDTTQLSAKLADLGFSVLPLSGEMSQRERNDAFRKFKTGVIQVLVATDVAARGLDVQDIARVIHADLPDNGEVLTHRSGRTGRAGREGQSIMLVGLREKRKAERMLRDAGVHARFVQPPTAEQIQEAADARMLAKLAGSGEAPSPRAHELAQKLLHGVESPTELVARLLDRLDYAGPTEAREVHLRTAKSRAKDDDGGPARGPSRKHDGSFVRFQVSWGGQQGADPGRLLAMVCRRGDITKAEVGSIRVGPRSSSVEIADSAAAAFERAVRRPDKGRDAHVKFRRWQEGGDGGADRSQFKRGRSPGKGGPKKGKGSFKKAGSGKKKSTSKKRKKS